jgi:hypothetical protein
MGFDCHATALAVAKVVSALAESDATEVAATLPTTPREFIVCFRQAFVGWDVVEPEWRVRNG